MQQVNFTDRINACAKLGDILRNPDANKFHSFRNEIDEMGDLISSSRQRNGWFTPENISFAIRSIGESLKPMKIEKWLNKYPEETFEKMWPRTIGVVMAGNVPLVGFHDYLCVMITGNNFLGKLSSDDNQLLPLINRIFEKIEPGFKERAEFTEGRIKKFDAVIATGSNNTARYFEYYFGKYPHIIRKTRNGVAVITANETEEQLLALGTDIFSYFGLGCRNVSKIFVPDGYDFKTLFEAIEEHGNIILHHKYKNNYDYNKSILLVNNTPHFDNGFLLLKQDASYGSPISVLHYENYHNINELEKQLHTQTEQIQCIVSANNHIAGAIAPGTSQKPDLWNYADNVDTIEFLMNLK